MAIEVVWCDTSVQMERPKLGSNRHSQILCVRESKRDSERDRDIKGRSPDSHTQKSVSRKHGAIEVTYKQKQRKWKEGTGW